MNSNCSDFLNQEQVKKAFCYQKLFWPFTVRINCSIDLKIFANSQPSASNFKSFSQALEQFFLQKGLLTFDHLALNSIAKMLEFYTYLFANRSLFERMQRNSKMPDVIANTFFFLCWKKIMEFFMLDNLLWGMSCKVSPNPIICCHQTYPVNLAQALRPTHSWAPIS